VDFTEGALRRSRDLSGAVTCVYLLHFANMRKKIRHCLEMSVNISGILEKS